MATVERGRAVFAQHGLLDVVLKAEGDSACGFSIVLRSAKDKIEYALEILIERAQKAPSDERVVAEVVAILSRNNRSAEWPEDERQAYQEGAELSFTTGYDRMLELRARKIIELVCNA